MEVTQEQKDVINSVYTNDENIIINAYAGSGKTTTIIETIKEIRKNDKGCNILYLVFNKSMAEDAKGKFSRANLKVDCYTTHGFAYKRLMTLGRKINIVNGADYGDFQEVKCQNYMFRYVKFIDMYDLIEAFGRTEDSINTFLDNLRNGLESDYDLTGNYSDSAINCFEEYYKLMQSKNKYTHNMYLKEYALNCHDQISNYKYVFLDEAQDLNPFMLKVISRIKRDKMWVVGDKYQKIYGWNNAINSMKYYKGRTYPLSVSFRLNKRNSSIANAVLAVEYEEFRNGSVIKPYHNETECSGETQAILFRRNAQMFDYAVKLIMEEDNIRAHFLDIVQGKNANLFDDTFSEMLYFIDQLICSKEGESDKLKRFRKSFKIKQNKKVNKYIKIAKKEGYDLYSYLYSFSSILDLDFFKYYNFFRMYEEYIVEVLDRVRSSENNPNPDKEYWLCTAYRSKGLEWDSVKIAPDAWDTSTEDELNLIYVACTRAKIHLDCSAVSDIVEIGISKMKEDKDIIKEIEYLDESVDMEEDYYEDEEIEAWEDDVIFDDNDEFDYSE